MKLYCMCKAQFDTPGSGQSARRESHDGQVFGAPNRYAALRPEDTDDFPPVMLQRAMTVLKVGVRQVSPQVLGKTPRNIWVGTKRPKYSKEHYPNVDVLECPHCHARVVLEG